MNKEQPGHPSPRFFSCSSIRHPEVSSYIDARFPTDPARANASVFHESVCKPLTVLNSSICLNKIFRNILHYRVSGDIVLTA
ncbi:hypothetical protein [Bhargavaea ullalensis]|uniref:hypothetical protein n=1 Tax=Bhargavaea ullalensis TaxID=1265685 RepID=UPI003391322D